LLTGFRLIFGVTIEEEALNGAFFIGFQRLTAIRTEISVLITAARGLMRAFAASYVGRNRRFFRRKITL
ncbi:MAG: hypothetical protein SOU82_01335, partial [Alloprevotella sp.]|nr:hypothetical protein [Alloprevotella sp.]